MQAAHDAGSRPRRRWARWALLLVPAIAFLGLLAAGVARRAGPPGPGEAAPPFTAPALAGDGTVSLAELEGRPVVLNFWASWCGPCRQEAPALQRAHEAYGDRVAIVGVDVRDSKSDALAFARRHSLDYALVRDESGSIASAYGLTGQPESFFIDSQGTVVEHVAGPVSEDDLATLLDVLVSRDR
ncbi:MAG TPA: TlpA disulfide reductase family protein [Actinomycetota bacterium]|nr:TlpA disulfide reductase family protein [Actinomycetota bacterium]